MIQIRKEFRFEASHILPHHPGKCSNLHGHSWVLEVGLEGYPATDSGFVLDYYDLGSILSPLIDCLDHTHLNFLIAYPSSENILIALGKILNPLVDDDSGFGEVQLTLKETQKTAATLFLKDLPLIMKHSPRIQLPDIQEVIEGSIVKPPAELIQRKQDSYVQAIALSRDAIEAILRRKKEGHR